MNERFLSKAKRVDNGEWVVGWFIQGLYMSPLIDDNDIVQPEYDYIYTTMIVEIDPTTLCQCTGIKKNGALIFEGDYFWHMIEDGLVGVVYWSDEDMCYSVRIVPNVVENECAPDFETTLEVWELWEYSEINILGNIHDKEGDL